MIHDTPFSDIALGDIISLPDGRGMTVRGKVTLPVPAGSMSAFLITGEFDALLSIPVTLADPLLVYVPIDYLPEAAENAKVVCEGAMNYWAPHLPALQGAMGEVLYRVVTVRGSVDPIVIIYRGKEMIVFIRGAIAMLDEISVLQMRRDVSNQTAVERHSAIVVSPQIEPPVIPLPEQEKRRVYAGQPGRQLTRG